MSLMACFPKSPDTLGSELRGNLRQGGARGSLHPTLALGTAWPGSPMPCCARRHRTRAGGRATQSPRSATATPHCQPWCARPRAAQWSLSSTGFTSPMRVHHVKQVMRGLCALAPPPLTPLGHAQIDRERLRRLLWNGCHEKACEALGRIASGAKDAIVPNEPAVKAKARHLGRALHGAAQHHRNQRGCADRLRPALPRWQADLGLIGRQYSQPAGERTHEQAAADALAALRRPPRAPVRAAVLDGRFGHPAIRFAA